MIIQGKIYDRGEWLRLLQMNPNTFNQRQHKGEISLALGLSRPAHMNEYGPLDAFAVVLTNTLARRGKVDLKTATEVVRAHWLDWLKGVAIAERAKGASKSEEICLALGATFDGLQTSFGASAGVGPRSVAVDMVVRSGDHSTIYVVELKQVLSELRANAAEAGVELPKMLTPAPPAAEEFEQWLAQIEQHRQYAATKAKYRRPTKAPKRGMSGNPTRYASLTRARKRNDPAVAKMK